MKAASSSVDSGLPAKLSARIGDPAYDAKASALSDRIDVLLDGNVLPEVTSFDVQRGLVVRHARGSDGKLKLDGGAPTFETLRGRVEVRWRHNAGDAA